MTDHKTNPDSSANNPTISQEFDTASSAGMDRRRLFRTLGAAGVVGAMGGFPSLVHSQDGGDFAKPENLKPGAQLDSRFPVSFATTVSEGLRLVVAYFTALNQRDLDGIADTLHFPFALYEEIEPIVVESPRDLRRNPPPTLDFSDSSTSAVAPGSYDLLESVNVHLYCPVGGVFSLGFTRYTADGHKLLDCEGIYSVTNNDGRWGIQLASTIFHERGYENVEYPDAALSHRVGSQGYLAAFGYRDEDLLNDLSTGRGSYEPELPVGTKRASVSFGYGPRARSRNARENHPMSGWEVSGVTSRLNVSEISESDGTGTIDTDLDQFVDLAGGTVGEYGYTRLRPERPLVIHATHDKAHVLRGYWRFTRDGTLISETRGAGIRIYKGGHWGDVGSLGQVTHHDRSNSEGR